MPENPTHHIQKRFAVKDKGVSKGSRIVLMNEAINAFILITPE
jgi:hypothetical protein